MSKEENSQQAGEEVECYAARNLAWLQICLRRGPSARWVRGDSNSAPVRKTARWFNEAAGVELQGTYIYMHWIDSRHTATPPVQLITA